MGTHLQPAKGPDVMRRRKSITMPDLKATMASSQYFLEHQESDSNGNVETQIYKGDIIPTAGGGLSTNFISIWILFNKLVIAGRAVIFRDREVLRQDDPMEDQKTY